ncbi:exodeoxyribonuclease VII small subunit [Delftia lacustris]|uniref:exodeoxyribonuclease VII small subunit n=1 Tax=Delftia lacustris TaxID=558537 RepID=UPI0035A6A318
MSTTFKESYGVLQRHAETLRKQSEPNIDDLLRIVEESVAAYKVCQERIDAVEMALEKALGGGKEQTADDKVSKPGARAPRSAPTADGGDDIPF